MAINNLIAQGMPNLGAGVMPAYYAGQENNRRNALVDQQIQTSKATAAYETQNAQTNAQRQQMQWQRQQTIQQMTEALGIDPGNETAQSAWEAKWGVPPGSTKGKWQQTQQVAAATLNPQAAGKELISPTETPEQKQARAMELEAVKAANAQKLMTAKEKLQQSNEPPVLIQKPDDPTATVYTNRAGAMGQGSASDAKAAKAQQDQAAANENAIVQGRQAIDVMQQAADQIKATADWTNTGPIAAKDPHGNFIRKNATLIPGVNDIDAALTTILGNTFFQNVNSMKNAKGQTGLGRVLQSEVPLLQAKLGAVKQSQGPEKLKASIDALMEQVKISQDRLEAASKSTPSKGSKPDANAPIGDLLKFYGGQ